MYKIFRTPTHHLGHSTEPDYLLYEGKLYPTAPIPGDGRKTRITNCGPTGKSIAAPTIPWEAVLCRIMKSGRIVCSIAPMPTRTAKLRRRIMP